MQPTARNWSWHCDTTWQPAVADVQERSECRPRAFGQSRGGDRGCRPDSISGIPDAPRDVWRPPRRARVTECVFPVRRVEIFRTDRIPRTARGPRGSSMTGCQRAHRAARFGRTAFPKTAGDRPASDTLHPTASGCEYEGREPLSLRQTKIPSSGLSSSCSNRISGGNGSSMATRTCIAIPPCRSSSPPRSAAPSLRRRISKTPARPCRRPGCRRSQRS